MLKSFVLCMLSICAVFGIFSFLFLCCKKTLKNTPIVICTYNDEEEIEGKLRLLMLEYPNTEIIVVDRESQDDTQKIVRKMMTDYKCIRLIKK